MIRAFLSIALVALAAGSASAQTVTEEDAQKVADAVVGELKREEVVPHKTFFASILAGYHGDVAGFGELRVGYGKGRFKRNLVLPTVTMWRVSAAVRGAYGRTDSVAASLLGGWGKVSLLGVTLEAGVDAHLAPGDVTLGPIATLGLRVGPFGLHTTVWTHLTGEETEGGFTIGLGYTIKDWKSPSEVARERAKEELLERGVPLP
ncbi:MAG: hypothetical protein K8M05_36880 [Deltaproteobacteria bacterium]|nr:hypothetical protein [Kofleriaceae bacterium]